MVGTRGATGPTTNFESEKYSPTSLHVVVVNCLYIKLSEIEDKFSISLHIFLKRRNCIYLKGKVRIREGERIRLGQTQMKSLEHHPGLPHGWQGT